MTFILLVSFFSTAGFTAAALPVEAQLELLRGEIGHLENELLSAKTQNRTAFGQLGKIRKLLKLQKKEIRLSDLRIQEFTRRLTSLAEQKQSLIDTIAAQKKQLNMRLRELGKLTEYEPLDTTFIESDEKFGDKFSNTLSARLGYLSNLTKKEIALVARLNQNANDALALELRIIEEKNQLEYYVQELKEQTSMMAANEQIQKEILITNQTNRLEAMKNLKDLKAAEKEITLMTASFNKINKKPISGVPAIVSLKGRLPLPVKGTVISGFGRSYNEKTNLFTFQKGVMIGSKNAEPVAAVAAGLVAYSGPLKHYGQIVILEHAGQYYTLYGQLSETSVRTGVFMKQGEVLGKSSSDPVYFEIRNKNIAINPLQWLTNGIK